MRAVVLVGGFGTRLQPLTHATPKPMLPVGHRPMLARLVDRLGAGGVTEVVLALGFRPEPFVEAFPDGRIGDVRLVYAVEPEPLDTAGAIRFAADAVGMDDTFVVANGDVMTDLSLHRLLDVHRDRGAAATIHLVGVDDPAGFGVVDLSDDLAVRAFVEKPAPGSEPSDLVNAGTYVFEPSVLDLIEPGRRVSIERDTFPRLVAAGSIFGVPTDDYWIDAGRPDLYRAANLDLLDRTRPGGACHAVADSAVVDPDATVDDSIVGDGARVGARAVVRRSVLLPGAEVGPDARVTASLVAGTVGAGAVVTDAVVGGEGRVPPGDTVESTTVPPVE